MLNPRFNACHANSGSPEKERRLLSYQKNDKLHSEEENFENPEKTHASISKQNIQELQAGSREKLKQTLLFDIGQEKKAEEENPNASDRSIDIVRKQKFRERRAEAFFNSDEDFYRRYIVSQLIQKAYFNVKEIEEERSILDVYAHATTAKLEEYAREYGIQIDKNNLPTSFAIWNRIYFDASREEFQDRDKRERMIAHELTHYALDKERENGMPLIKEAEHIMTKLPMWNELKSELVKGFSQSTGVHYAGLEAENVHEILAVYVSGRRRPFLNKEDPCHKIYQLMTQALHTNTRLKSLVLRIEEDLAADFEEMRGQSIESADEQQGNKSLLPTYREQEERFVRSRAFVDESSPLAEEEAQVPEQDRPGTLRELRSDAIKTAQQSVDDLQRIFGVLRHKLGELSANLNNMPNIDNPARYRADISGARQYLDRNGSELVVLRSYLDALSKIEEGQMSPSQIRQLERRMKMNGLDIKEKRALVFNEINKEIATINSVAVDIQNYIQSAGLTVDQDEDKPEGQKILHFYSLLEMWGGMMDIKDAIYNAWDADRKRRRFRFAKEFSPILEPLPYGQSVVQTLSKQARASNDEETSKYMDYLKSEGFTYDELLGSTVNLMTQNRGSINRQKAIVEYAADHGWLYRLNRKNGHNVYGLDFAGHFGTQSFLELIDRNEKGKKSEIERGEQRAKYLPEISLIIDEMRDELTKKNIYAVRGMLQIIQNKGKVGECNTWGMVTVMRALRRDPGLLKVLDSGLLDNMGNIGIEQAGWSLTMFKMQRNQFLAWKQRGGKDFTGDEKFVLARTIAAIEERMPAKLKNAQTPAEYAVLDHAVAKVLAGQIFIDGDIKISIFENQFRDYRNFFLDRAQTTTKTASTDDDFFNPDAGGSDILLVGRKIVEEINTRDSTGRPTHPAKAQGFWAQVIDRYDELASTVSPQAAEQFRIEMRYKTREWVHNYIIGNAASLRQFGGESDVKRRNLVNNLRVRGLLTKQEAETIRKGYGDPESLLGADVFDPTPLRREITKDDPTERWKP